MNFRSTLWNTLWLILVLVGLVLYLVLIEAPTAEKKDEEATHAKQALHFKVEDVQEFDLIKPTGTIKIRRNPENSRWNISEPLAVQGEDGVINQLLVTLEDARIGRVVDEEPKDLSGYGLQDPSLQVTLRFKSGEPVTLLLGDSSPIGPNSYIKLADEKRVLLAFIDKNILTSSVNDLRSKTLLDFVAKDVTAVDLTYEGKAQRFAKEGEHWKLTAPVNARGDADEISNFLNGIRMERIETFVSETPENLASLGLTQPRITLNIHAEKSGQSWTLKIGKAYDDHSYYVQRGQSQNVVTVSDSLVETLAKNPLSFMEKSLLSFKEEDMAEIEVRQGKETVRLVRDAAKPGQWQFADSSAGPVDSATVNTLLLDLMEARIRDFAPIQKLKLFGLESPRKTLTLITKDGTKETLGLGNPDKEKLNYFVTRSADRTVFKLDTGTVEKVFRSPMDFKDKKLLKFDPEQVARIGIETPDQTFELDRRDKKWVLVKPKALDELKPFVGKDILWTLSNLEYEAKLNANEVAGDTGLEKPRMTITLQDGQNRSLGTLKIGGPVKGQPLLFSQLAGDPALYHIKDRTLGEIPDRLDRFQKKAD